MLCDVALGGYERRVEEVEKGGVGWMWWGGVSGMGEEGRPLWAGVIREPFMGETITGCDSGAQPKSPLQPFASRGPSQPPDYWTVRSAMHGYAHVHTPMPPPLHIWPSLICCIRKRRGWVKGRKEGKSKEMAKKNTRELTQFTNPQQMHTNAYTPGGVVWCLEPDSEGFYLGFGRG